MGKMILGCWRGAPAEKFAVSVMSKLGEFTVRMRWDTYEQAREHAISQTSKHGRSSRVSKGIRFPLLLVEKIDGQIVETLLAAEKGLKKLLKPAKISKGPKKMCRENVESISKRMTLSELVNLR